MSMFSRFLEKKRPQVTDAKRVYSKLMLQSRRPALFENDRMPDTYEGRVELITLHMSIVIYALRSHGENGEKLSQALFDVMVDDFDSALRGEGLTDSGVKRRIKPIVELFYARLKAYTEGLNNEDLSPALSSGQLGSVSEDVRGQFAAYSFAFNQSLEALTLGDIALANFSFPKLT